MPEAAVSDFVFLLELMLFG